METHVIRVRSDEETAARAAAAEGARALRAGKLVGFGTETVYGIAAIATNAETMARLLEERPREFMADCEESESDEQG